MLDEADNDFNDLYNERDRAMTIETKCNTGDEMSEWQRKREMHSKMMGAATNAGDMEAVKFHSTHIMQCDRMIAFLERKTKP